MDVIINQLPNHIKSLPVKGAVDLQRLDGISVSFVSWKQDTR